jgi:hypothetical protein
LFTYTAANAVGAALSAAYGFTGVQVTNASGKQAGLEALRDAAALLHSGHVERVLVFCFWPTSPDLDQVYRGLECQAQGGQESGRSAPKAQDVHAAALLLGPLAAQLPQLRLRPVEQDLSEPAHPIPAHLDQPLLWCLAQALENDTALTMTFDHRACALDAGAAKPWQAECTPRKDP